MLIDSHLINHGIRNQIILHNSEFEIPTIVFEKKLDNEKFT